MLPDVRAIQQAKGWTDAELLAKLIEYVEYEFDGPEAFTHWLDDREEENRRETA